MLETEGALIPYDASISAPDVERSYDQGRFELDEISGPPKAHQIQ